MSLHRADAPMPAADEPARHVALPPGLEHLTGSRAKAIDRAGGAIVKEARKLNGPGAIVVSLLVLAGLAVYFFPPIRTASSEDVMTKEAHREYAESVKVTLAKHEKQMDKLQEIANTQALTLVRVTVLLDAQNERIKALEARPR